MWLKVESKLPSHPKVCDAGDRLGAYGSGRVLALWLFGATYAVEHLTDGFIPRAVIAQCPHVRQPLVVAQAMVSAGLWHRANGGWTVHDFSRYNPSGADVKASRDYERDKKRRQRANCPGSVPRVSRRDKRAVPPVVPGDTGGDSRARASEYDLDLDPKQITPSIDEGFGRFWQAYPRKVAKPKALLAFRKAGPTDALVAAMLAALARQARSEQWRKDGGQFIPHPATWLHQRRWEDEASTAPVLVPRDDWREECARVHDSRCTNVHFHEATLAKESA